MKTLITYFLLLCGAFAQVTPSRNVTANPNTGALIWPTSNNLSSGRGGPLSRTVVATHANGGQDLSGATPLSNGTTDLQATCRRQHIIEADCTALQVMYGNWNGSNPLTGEIFLADTITVKAALEDSSANIYPITFGGLSTGTISAGRYLISDPLPVTFSKGSTIWTRTNVSVEPGKKWPQQQGLWGSISGQAVELNVDKAYSGTISGSGFVYAPAAIFGRPTSSTQPPMICVFGDSRPFGTGDTLEGNGEIMRALGNPWATNYPTVNLGYSGDTVRNVINPAKFIVRGLLLQGCQYVIGDMGFNDVQADRTALQIEGDLQTLWAYMTSAGIKRIAWCTMGPDTTSTDGWVTTANQTIWNSGRNTIRIAVNNWLRTKPAPLYIVFDVATALESAIDSGKFKVQTISGCSTTNSSTAITLSSTSLLTIGQGIAGTGIQANSTIATITDGTHATITPSANATNSGLTLTVGLTNAGVHYNAAGSVNASTVIDPTFTTNP